MLNALLVTAWPENGWSRIANRESYKLTFAFAEWFFIALVSCVIEGVGMFKFGAGTNSIGSVYNLSMDAIVEYEVKYIITLMFFLVLAAVIVHYCIRGSFENVKFQNVLTVILYLSCSVLFMKILDASPYVVLPKNSSHLCLCGFFYVVMMKTTSLRDGYDFSLFRCLDWSRIRAILIQ